MLASGVLCQRRNGVHLLFGPLDFSASRLQAVETLSQGILLLLHVLLDPQALLPLILHVLFELGDVPDVLQHLHAVLLVLTPVLVLPLDHQHGLLHQQIPQRDTLFTPELLLQSRSVVGLLLPQRGGRGQIVCRDPFGLVHLLRNDPQLLLPLLAGRQL